MFSPTLSAKRNDSWNTSATAARNSGRLDVARVDAADPDRRRGRARRARRRDRTACSCPSRSRRRARRPRPARPRNVQSRTHRLAPGYANSMPSTSTASGPAGSGTRTRGSHRGKRGEDPIDARRSRRPNAASPRAGSRRRRIGNASSVNSNITVHELARCDRALRDPPSAEREDRDAAEVGHRVERRLEERAQLADRDPLGAQAVGRHRQPVPLERLETERLHRERAVEALVRDRRHLADPLLHHRRPAPRPVSCTSGSARTSTGTGAARRSSAPGR